MRGNLPRHMRQIHGGSSDEPSGRADRGEGRARGARHPPRSVNRGSGLILKAAAVALLVGLAGLALALSNPGDSGGVGISVGQTAPDFTLREVDSGTFSLSNFRGKPVVVTFMAAWCSTCLLEQREINTVFDEYSAKGVVFISVSLDYTSDTEAALRNFKVRNGGGPAQIFALDTPQERVGVTYRANFDHTYFLDPSGTIAFKDGGITPASKFASVLDSVT